MTHSMPQNAEKLTVRVSKFIRAPRDRVFEAWLKPEIRRKWWIFGGEPCLTECKIDARAGGRYVMKQVGGCKEDSGMPADYEWVMQGEFVEIDAPRRLVFTWNVNHKPPVVNNRVTIEFREAPGGTEVVLSHEGLLTKELRDGTDAGWTELLGHMATVLEQR